MKVRDSGMPEEDYWESLFDVEFAIERFGIGSYTDVAELGCGYGTFTIPMAKVIRGTLHCFDIDPFMVERTCLRAKGLPVRVELRDVLESGFGIKADAVVLFNILHCEDPVRLLSLSADAAPNILVTHWQSKQTPRGPSHKIRPTPTQIFKWANDCGLEVFDQFELPPWHFGMVLRNQFKIGSQVSSIDIRQSTASENGL